MELSLNANESALIDEFIRLRADGGGVVLEVAMVCWRGSHEPYLEWHPFRRWKRPPTLERVANAKRRALASRRFFRVCEFCGLRFAAGQMSGFAILDHPNDPRCDMCHGCAEARGVTF